MKKINVLFISGIPNNKLVEVVSINKNLAKYILTGSANIISNINDERLYKKYLKLDTKSNQEISLAGIDIIFNQVSDPDSHTKVLMKLSKIRKNNLKIPIINQPFYIQETSRDRIYLKLKGISNLNVPKTKKFVPLTPFDIDNFIKKNAFSFPIILRKLGTHGGESVKLLNSFEDTKTLYDVALDGSAFYLIQYVNYKEGNIYKKFRLVVIDGEVYIRHVIFGEEWMVHARSKEKKYMDDEIKVLHSFETKIKPKIKNTITQIYKKVKLDYFGIDCYIDKDFKITLFELNANMNILIGASENTIKYVDKLKDAIVEMIIKKVNQL